MHQQHRQYRQEPPHGHEYEEPVRRQREEIVIVMLGYSVDN